MFTSGTRQEALILLCSGKGGGLCCGALQKRKGVWKKEKLALSNGRMTPKSPLLHMVPTRKSLKKGPVVSSKP